MQNPDLFAAYRAARVHGYGVATPRPADLALRFARDALTALPAARFNRETAAALRDAAKVAAADALAAQRVAYDAARLASPHGAGYGGEVGRDAWRAHTDAQRVAKTAADALADAERALERATRALRAAESAVRDPAAYGNPRALGRPSYGPGTWQGGEVNAEGGKVGPARSMHNRPDAYSGDGFGFRRESPGRRYGWHGESGAAVFRNVRDAEEVARLGHSGWHADPFGDGNTCKGVVAQLRARDGRAVYVAGYRFTDADDSGTFDLGDLFAAEGRDESDAEEAARDAARRADSLAERAAEREREWQAAWHCGTRWADLGEEVATLRAEARGLLAERRAATGPAATRRALMADRFPALCATVRARVAAIVERIAEARAERARMADGEGDGEYIGHDGRADAVAAFCEGAGIPVEAFPA